MTAIILIFACYFLLVMVLVVGWRHALQQRLAPPAALQRISVVIAVRNEAANITTLLNSLAAQQHTHYEVIVVNDHSTDGTSALLQTFSFPWLSVIQNTGEGKKRAITTGVQHATGDIVVTTDADCVVSPQWLGAMSHAFSNERIMLAFGAVRIAPGTSFFSTMQAMEFASLGGTSAATAALGLPTMCNGANLAYRKVAFEAVQGYEGNLQILSGDDEFLMRKIKRQYPHSICFVAQETAVVSTAPQPGLLSFFEQRLRWAAKWRHNTSAYTVALAIFIFCCQLAVLVCLVVLATKFSYIALILLLLKALLEAVLLSGVCRFLKVPFYLPAFIALQFLYPLYAISVGVASNVMSYRWKGRGEGELTERS